jgi:transcription initiation factor IIE alpha subunit
MTGSLKDQLLALMVCSDCGAPVEYDKQDKVYRHKEPLDRYCKRAGYPVKTKVKAN